jgi:hypothetical protein
MGVTPSDGDARSEKKGSCIPRAVKEEVVALSRSSPFGEGRRQDLAVAEGEGPPCAVVLLLLLHDATARGGEAPTLL